MATYHVSATTGSDTTGDGSLLNPWATFAKAQSSISPGDTVIARGGTYQLGCTIAKANTYWQNYSGESPLIDGEAIRPGGEWDPLVRIESSGVTWDGIHVARSTGYNMHIDSPSDPPVNLSDVSVINSQIHNSNHQNLVVEYTTGLLLYRNSFAGGNYVLRNGIVNGSSIVIMRSTGAIVRGNVIREAMREGLILGPNAISCLAEYNEIYGNRYTQLYFCNSTLCIARYNLVYGWIDDQDIVNGRSNAGSGIVLGSEAQWGTIASNTHKIYGNLVAGCTKNLAFQVELNANPITNCLAFQNSFILAQPVTTTTTDWCGIYVGNRVGTGNVVKNNIIWQVNNPACTVLTTGAVTFDYNLWTKLPPTAARGANDPKTAVEPYYYTTPGIFKESGWENIRSGGLTGGEFDLQAGSPAIGAATVMEGESDQLPNCSESNWITKNVVLRTNSGPDIGGEVYIAAPPSIPPSTPTGLQCSVVSAQSISCSWDAALWADYYQLYRNGVLM